MSTVSEVLTNLSTSFSAFPLTFSQDSMSVSTTGHRNGSRTSETGTELGLGEGDPSHDRFEDFEFVGGGCFECTPEQVDNADTDTDTAVTVTFTLSVWYCSLINYALIIHYSSYNSPTFSFIVLFPARSFL